MVWVERLFHPIIDDGVQYLAPVEDRWGEIAGYPELGRAARRLRQRHGNYLSTLLGGRTFLRGRVDQNRSNR